MPEPIPEIAAPISTLAAADSQVPVRTVSYAGAPSSSVTAMPSIPGYEAMVQIGRGGMGLVCKARHVGLNRVVAVKMLQGADASPDEMARLRQEAVALAQLQHPNIVQIFEVGEHDGRMFFTMEYCAEGALAKKLARAPLPPREAATLVETLARAMQAAHDRQIIHRDLKPANVLLADGDIPKIADFGLAKRLDTQVHQTQTGAIMGTPSYMAPEQARGDVRAVGPAADVYALGAILYETLTGRAPFKAATIHETILQVIDQDPVAPTTVQPAVPRDLETICVKCLEKKPEHRYASAAALADDLHRFLDGVPIVARPAGALERAGKWMRRHPATTAAWVFLTMSIALLAWAVLASGRALEAESANRKNLEAQAEQKLKDEKGKQVLLRQEEVKRARQSGNWRDVLAALDAAVELGYELSPEDRLMRVDALVNLYRNAEARAELDRATPYLTMPEQLAVKDLYQANLLWFDDDVKALELMRRALPNLRDPAQKAYAEGLTAPKVLDAIAHFRTALKHNRLHADARKSLGMCLMTLGRVDEARQVMREGEVLTPDDPAWLVGFALLETLRPTRDAKAADHPLARLRAEHPDLDPEMLEAIEAGLSFLPKFAILYRSAVGLKSIPEKEYKQLVMESEDAARKFLQMAAKHKHGDDDARFALKFHPAILNYVSFWTEMLPAAEKNGGGLKPADLQRLRQLAQDYPEATLLTITGHIDFISQPTGIIAQMKQDDLARMSGYFKQAYEARDNAFHDVRIMALDGWIFLDGIRGSPNVPMANLGARARAADNVEAYLKEFGTPFESRFEIYFKVCKNAERWSTARIVSDHWLKDSPKNVAAIVMRADLELKAGKPAEALEFARRGLVLAPKHQELRAIEKMSAAQVRSLLDVVP